MDAATLQKRIYGGYGKASLRIGKLAMISRPASPAMSLEGNVIDSAMASLTQNFEYSKFNKYGNSIWISIHDGALTQTGDYLTTEDGTWFIAAQQPLLPILAVQCNRTIDVVRVTQTGYGSIGYGGDTPATEQAVMSGWPASVLEEIKGGKNPAELPQDERLSYWSILFPFFGGVIMRPSDIIKDDLGRRYAINAPELTDLGWRITASLQVP